MDAARGLLPLSFVALSFGCGPPKGFSLDEEGGETEGTPGTTAGSGGGGGGGEGEGGGSDGVAPQLISARTDESGAFVLLRFSEPMAPPTGVDPSDFRISVGFTIQWDYDPYPTAYSTYQDPHYYFDFDPPYAYGSIVGVSAGGLATDLVLEFAEPLHPYTCTALAMNQEAIEDYAQYEPAFMGRVDLFPHFAPGDIPVRSAQGEDLAAIGADWVLNDAPYMEVYAYGFPNLSPQIPIDCIIGP